MVYKYLYIESKSNLRNFVPVIMEVFSSIINVDKFFFDDYSITLFYSNEITENIRDVIYNLVEDTYIDLRVYQSKDYKKMSSLESEFENIKLFLKNIPFHLYTFISNQIILSENLFKIDDKLKQIILGFYKNNSEMIKTVKTYLEYNQNMSNAAKILYLHRNTLNQRLEKFQIETGFNVKNFKDAFLIYHLIK